MKLLLDFLGIQHFCSCFLTCHAFIRHFSVDLYMSCIHIWVRLGITYLAKIEFILLNV